jgi:hypothetical protein
MEEIVITQEMIEEERLNNLKELASKRRAIKIEALQTSVNGVDYNSNPKAQNNMTSVGCIANWQFNLNLKNQMEKVVNDSESSPDLKQVALTIIGTYNAVYKKNTVEWKTLDGSKSNVQVDSILTALHKTMVSKGKVITDE